MAHILYIEDQANLRQPKIFHFKGDGHTVDAAANNDEAEVFFKQKLPDIVVADYELGGGETSLPFVRWMRGQPAGEDVPVLLLSNTDFIDIKAQNPDLERLNVGYIEKIGIHKPHADRIALMLSTRKISPIQVTGGLSA